LKVHPEHQALLLSASRDLSIRLWNMHSGVLIMIFAGEGGHRNEVLTCDWQRGARCTLASAGMDCTVKVWTATDADWAAVEEALQPWDPARPLGTFRTRFVQLPEFSTYRIHANYVDCVRFFGPRGALLSKSVDCHVTLWQPEEGPYAADGQVRTLAHAELVDADLWFLRFALCARSRVLACGNRCGVVRVWDMEEHPPQLLAQLHARPPSSASHKAKAAGVARAKPALPVRQAMPSADGRIVIACCEDGTIWRWDKRSS
jgi:polycomb protein EED